MWYLERTLADTLLISPIIGNRLLSGTYHLVSYLAEIYTANWKSFPADDSSAIRMKGLSPIRPLGG